MLAINSVSFERIHYDANGSYIHHKVFSVLDVSKIKSLRKLSTISLSMFINLTLCESLPQCCRLCKDEQRMSMRDVWRHQLTQSAITIQSPSVKHTHCPGCDLICRYKQYRWLKFHFHINIIIKRKYLSQVSALC